MHEEFILGKKNFEKKLNWLINSIPRHKYVRDVGRLN